MTKTILARKPYSANTGDEHLEIVLAQTEDIYHPYVTWGYNKQTKGYFWGHYFSEFDKALEDFNKRP